MKLIYDWDPNIIDISEAEVLNDIEFSIKVVSPPHFEDMRIIQKIFDSNHVITDVLVYTYTNHEYRVIVRKDYYEDFILQLMKYRLLTKVEWNRVGPCVIAWASHRTVRAGHRIRLLRAYPLWG